MSTPAVVTYPDGTTFTSTALSQADFTTILQTLTAGLLGYAANDPTAGYYVRREWIQDGEPAFGPGEDRAFLHAVPDSLPQYLIRDRNVANSNGVVLSQDNYTRLWRCSWTHYGPNSTERASIVAQGLLSAYALGTLQAAKLGIDPTFSWPVRAPEFFSGKWYERADFTVTFTERVSATTTIDEVASASVVVQLQVSAPNGYGAGNYGVGEYGQGRVLTDTTTNATAAPAAD